jgi:phage head maturation protease
MTTERRDVPPREDLLRMVPFSLRADDTASGSANDGQTLDGFASVFNTLTLIDSWEGRFYEQVLPGSMKKSFREKPPKIQFDHGRHPLIGSIPIARLITAEEASDPVLAPSGGAHIVGRVFDNWLMEPVRDAIAAETIDGMSFRFSVIREAWFEADGKPIRDEEKLREILRRSWYEEVPEDELPRRDLKELRVPEAGPVVWPAYDETSVGMRSRTITIDLGRLGDREQRSALAQAVLLAESADRTIEEDDAPPTNQEPPADHPSEALDAPVVDSTSPGEHPSAPPRRTKPGPKVRQVNPAKEFAKHVADHLLSLEGS